MGKVTFDEKLEIIEPTVRELRSLKRNLEQKLNILLGLHPNTRSGAITKVRESRGEIEAKIKEIDEDLRKIIPTNMQSSQPFQSNPNQFSTDEETEIFNTVGAESMEFQAQRNEANQQRPTTTHKPPGIRTDGLNFSPPLDYSPKTPRNNNPSQPNFDEMWQSFGEKQKMNTTFEKKTPQRSDNFPFSNKTGGNMNSATYGKTMPPKNDNFQFPNKAEGNANNTTFEKTMPPKSDNFPFSNQTGGNENDNKNFNHNYSFPSSASQERDRRYEQFMETKMKNDQQMKQDTQNLRKKDDEIRAGIHARMNEMRQQREREIEQQRELSRADQNQSVMIQMLTQMSRMQEQFMATLTLNQNQNQNQNFNQRGNNREGFIRRIRNMPIFSGESMQKLRDFIQLGNLLFQECQNENERREFYFQVKYCLRGEAREVLKYTEDDWFLIQAAIKQRFAYLMNRNIINSKLENLHQEQKETLSQYAERARKTLIEKNNSYDEVSREQREDHDRTARKAFIKGIQDQKIRSRLTIRGSYSLEDAISSAIEAENDHRHDISDRELFCTNCNRNGHRERDCRQRSGSNNIINQLTRALGSQNNNQYRNNNFQNSNNFQNNNTNRNNAYQNNNTNRNTNWNNNNNNNTNNNTQNTQNSQNSQTTGGNANFGRNGNNNTRPNNRQNGQQGVFTQQENEHNQVESFNLNDYQMNYQDSQQEFQQEDQQEFQSDFETDNPNENYQEN